MMSADPFQALRGLRIGCVRYLNSRPLIEPYDGPVVFDHPSVLAVAMQRGELDAALVPVYEALRMPGCHAVKGACIASSGPVWSVILAYQGEFEAIRTVSLDPASRTSVHLCRALFAEWGGGRIPEYVPEPAPAGAARVIIGNQAIEFREKHEGEYRILDLGEAWKRHTGLPFVFAVWLIRGGVANLEAVADAFREILRQGMVQMDEIVARNRGEHPAGFVRRYLTEYIRFDLGADERCGIERFRELLCKHRLLPPETKPLRFV